MNTREAALFGTLIERLCDTAVPNNAGKRKRKQLPSPVLHSSAPSFGYASLCRRTARETARGGRARRRPRKQPYFTHAAAMVASRGPAAAAAAIPGAPVAPGAGGSGESAGSGDSDDSDDDDDDGGGGGGGGDGGGGGGGGGGGDGVPDSIRSDALDLRQRMAGHHAAAASVASHVAALLLRAVSMPRGTVGDTTAAAASAAAAEGHVARARREAAAHRSFSFVLSTLGLACNVSGTHAACATAGASAATAQQNSDDFVLALCRGLFAPFPGGGRGSGGAADAAVLGDRAVAAIVRGVILPKVLALRQTASRALFTGVSLVTQRHPRVVADELVAPTLIRPWTSVGTGAGLSAPQAEFVHRLLRECFAARKQRRRGGGRRGAAGAGVGAGAGAAASASHTASCAHALAGLLHRLLTGPRKIIVAGRPSGAVAAAGAGGSKVSALDSAKNNKPSKIRKEIFLLKSSMSGKTVSEKLQKSRCRR